MELSMSMMNTPKHATQVGTRNTNLYPALDVCLDLHTTGEKVDIDFWDTAGQERFNCV